MRHLASLVFAPLLAAAAYLLAGAGSYEIARIAALTDDGLRLEREERWLAIAMVVGAGLVYGVLVLARWSPLGTVVAGLGLAALGAAGVYWPARLESLTPDSVLGYPEAATRLSGPVAILLAVPLLLTLFMPSRWRRGTPYAQAPAGYQAPGAPQGPAGQSGIESMRGWSDEGATTRLPRVRDVGDQRR